MKNQNLLNQKTSWLFLRVCIVALALAILLPWSAPAQNADLEELKTQVKTLEQTINEMKQKIADLEKAKAAPPPAAPVPPRSALDTNSPSIHSLERVAAGEKIAEQSPIADRGAMNDQQEAASRPKDYTLDPTFRGFIPIPNTPVLINSYSNS